METCSSLAYGSKAGKRVASLSEHKGLGFPRIKGDKASYAPMVTFPTEEDTVPEEYSGWLLFLDEFNSSSPAVQAASYKLVLDRMVGQYKLHNNVAIVCAGNLETDNAIVQPMSTALQSRLVHLELEVDATEWDQWATDAGIDHRITSYIKFKPGNLYNFRPDHTDATYASPRTWEFANRLLKIIDINEPDAIPLLAGTLSEGIAREFLGFCRIYTDLPEIDSIKKSPETINVPSEPSILYALTGSISHHANEDNIEPLMVYIRRLPIEFQIVCMRDLVRRKKKLNSTKPVQQWITESSANIF